MIPVAMQFEDQTFTYTSIERCGDLAIYCQEHKESQVQRFEVVRIRIRKAHTWPNGKTTPAHEAYPGAKRWGIDGFTHYTLEDAQAQMAELVAKHDPVAVEEG